MTLHIPQQLLERMKRHALSEFPLECCGILIGRRIDDQTMVDELILGRNISEDDRRRSYQIDWTSLFSAVRGARTSGKELIGFYHSHPDGTNRPSARDREQAWSDRVYVILSIDNARPGGMTAWRRTRAQRRLESEPILVT